MGNKATKNKSVTENDKYQVNYMNNEILTILFIVILCSFINISRSQYCPSGFNHCAAEGNVCRITYNPKGYISYGVNGRWNFIPFRDFKSHQHANSFEFKCDNSFGDIYPGTRKHCCYKHVKSIGIANDGIGYYGGENYPTGSNMVGNGNPYYTVRYGNNGHFFYRFVRDTTTTYCKNDFFNDPEPKAQKKYCTWHNNLPSNSLKTTNWQLCGREGDFCRGLVRDDRAQWIRYGYHNKYYYRFVESKKDGIVPCNDHFFDDPAPWFSPKECWRSQPFYVGDAPPQQSPPQISHNYESDLFKSLRFTSLQIDIGFVIIGILVLVNIGYWIYYFCQKQKEIENKYKAVKMVTSDSDITIIDSTVQ